MPILAQQAEITGWASLVSSVVSGGFAGVVAWYLLTKALPRIAEKQEQAQDAFSKTLQSQQAAFTATLEKQRATFEQAIKEQQERFERRDEMRRVDDKAGLEAVLEHCERESERRAEIHKVEMGLVKQQLQDVGTSLEEVRGGLDDVRAGLDDLGARRRRRQRPPGPPPQQT